jgi:hypothetical protein
MSNKGEVISQKVLKKEQINSTMNISVLTIINQIISEIKHYTSESDQNNE